MYIYIYIGVCHSLCEPIGDNWIVVHACIRALERPNRLGPHRRPIRAPRGVGPKDGALQGAH